MNNITKLLAATQYKPVLIRRLIDIVLFKLGKQKIIIPTFPKRYNQIELKKITLNISENSSVLEDRIAEKMMQNIFCILDNKWRSFFKQTSDDCRIVWQTDYKSGYTFDINQTSSQCLMNIPEGVDIKTPWELARMQHLPFLARFTIAGKISKENGCIIFCKTVTDFITNNPIGYGANWACPMDVAIRAANILVAYDLLYSFEKFDKGFIDQLSFSIVEHGAFIYRNLEKNFTDDKSGNHYLSDLCGLIVIGIHIEEPIGKKWLQFAADELFKEIDKQIFDDGGNYEFSTAYHRLDSEIIAVAIAFLVSAGFKIPCRISTKIHKMLDFMKSILYSDGQIVQIGDNDSGHLLRLSYHGIILNDNPVIDELDGHAAVDLLQALFVREGASPEHLFIRSLMNNGVLKWEETQHDTFFESRTDVKDCKYKTEYQFKIEAPGEINIRVYSDFGLAVFAKEKFKAFFRLPTDVSRGKLIHIHSDFLHFEYECNGVKHFRDRGSYTYSGNIQKRNLFRSAKFHNVPQYDAEQNSFTGAWGVKHLVSGSWHWESDCSIVACMNIEKAIHSRRIIVGENVITMSDESNTPFDKGYVQENVDSTGYGILTNQTTTEK